MEEVDATRKDEPPKIVEKAEPMIEDLERKEKEIETLEEFSTEPAGITLVDDVKVIEGELSKPAEITEPPKDTAKIEEITAEEVEATRKDEPSEVKTATEKAKPMTVDLERKEEPAEVKTTEQEFETSQTKKRKSRHRKRFLLSQRKFY